MGEQPDHYPQMMYYYAAQLGEGVEEMHPDPRNVGFTENAFCADLRVVDTSLNEALFDPAPQTTPYPSTNANSALLRDQFFGPQVPRVDTGVQITSPGPGPGDRQNKEAQASLISANFVLQSPLSFESMSRLDQTFAEPLSSWDNSGETGLAPPSFPPDLSGTDGLFNFDSEETVLPLAKSTPTVSNSCSDYICFDNHGWCTDVIRAPLIAPKPSAPTMSPSIPFLGPSSHPAPPSAQKRKRSQFNYEGKKKMKIVRKRGACLRCKIYKLSCDEEIPCINCLKVKDRQKVFFGPCIRPNIIDVQSFRAGDGDNGQIRSILPEYKWLPGWQTMTVKLQWPFRGSRNNEPILEVACQMFEPKRGQITAEEFQINDQVRQVDLPPWACRDTESAQRNIGRFLGECQELLEEEIHATLKDNIMRHTWAEVIRYRATHKSTLVTRALQVFAGAMMNSRYPMSLKANVFGVPDELVTPHFFERLPLPAQLTYQIQTMIIDEMLNTQTLLLKELKNRIFNKNRQRYWYEVYLAVFILLATIEFVYRAQMRFVRAKAGMSDRSLTNIAYVTQAMLDEWESSARNLINHFRCVMNGELPFGQSWEEGSENPRRTGLDADAVEYIRATQREIAARLNELSALRKLDSRTRFESPLGAICELLLPSEA
ncbi:hypothetical protein F4802DRAFT_533130 [Xylaria palmicola]|nr:hypothetical protein F4802DRAFT_533130 [Xylaria palmicola]